jgi:rare lipoprotein A (peptidoglycan hydrolase)
VPPAVSVATTTPAIDAAAAARHDPRAQIADFVSAASLPAVRPTPPTVTVARTQAKSPPHPKLTGHSRTGSASWYCKTGVSVCMSGYPGGLYAAAGPALRVGSWRGRTVRVCGSGSCVWVTLIDYCACGSGHMIDLYGDAFRRLAPLSAGALHVTVSW